MTALDAWLAEQANQTESFFRAALAREDQARLAKMRELASSAADFDAFAHGALFVGWTPGDLRSKDLAEPLGPVLDYLWQAAHGGEDETGGERLLAAWHSFNAERMRILIHCL